MDVMSSAGTDEYTKLAPNGIIEHIHRRVLCFGVRCLIRYLDVVQSEWW